MHQRVLAVLQGRKPDRIEHLLQLIGDRPIILGVGDAVMSNNDLDRVRYIAERIENHPI